MILLRNTIPLDSPHCAKVPQRRPLSQWHLPLAITLARLITIVLNAIVCTVHRAFPTLRGNCVIKIAWLLSLAKYQASERRPMFKAGARCDTPVGKTQFTLSFQAKSESNHIRNYDNCGCCWPEAVISEKRKLKIKHTQTHTQSYSQS